MRSARREGRGWTLLLLVLTCVTLLAAAGCGGGSGEAESIGSATEPVGASASPAASKSPDQETDFLEKFRSVAAGAKQASELMSFLEDHIGDTNEDTADTMIRELNAYYKADLKKLEEAYTDQGIQDKLVKLKWPITEDAVDSISDEAAKKLVKATFEGGYKLEMAEGYIFPIVDYSRLKAFSSHLSGAMNEYIAVKAVESDKPAAKDAALVIAWDELASRAQIAEAFVKKHPDSPEREEIELLYVERYLSMYIYGLNNTPIFDYETFVLLPEVKMSYEKTVQASPGSVTGTIVKDYLSVLAGTKEQVYENKNGRQIDIPAVKDFHERFQAEAKERLQSR
ncbi:hypothetical protein ACFO9Q_09265 [Paenibacillus sp. GCM10023252]|uniref:hypothetical protein n=1 Tax=Paenibacillus sp. GCM10023252 TaxID=3252649 RepID=UPI003612DCD4